ncbi:MAG: trehalose-phosphatase [Bacteroidales bacterium]
MIDALIFDLDGVITQTRKTHRKAWKELFDWYFERQGKGDNAPMSELDYELYIDGKPRYQGVHSFLESRGIGLPFGNTEDPPGQQSICALGNKKNEIFNEVIDRDGVEVYPDAVDWLKKWRGKGLKTAIVSSSKNCRKVLEAAGLTHLFDARVDGLVSEELGLKGKPDPDIFVEAARQLGTDPLHAVVFEDAISGVQAGQHGFFALVVGVDRFNNGEALRENGADEVITDFSDLDLSDKDLRRTYFSLQGEPVFPDNKEIFKTLSDEKPVIFLDYDGTLTPIVSRPEDALIADEMKQTLRELATLFTVAVVTGRDKDDVEQLVGLDGLIYAGSHGYIITGPDGLFMEHEDSKKIIPKLDQIEKEVEQALEGRTRGVQVDRKRYAIGIHYRNARPEDEEIVFRVVEDMLRKHPGHKKGAGKKIVEIKPDLDWHKGKAVLWILDALQLKDRKDHIPVFIGDDITDEDGFEALKDIGFGILVGGHGQETAARYSLKNVFQVRMFFRRLIDMYR